MAYLILVVDDNEAHGYSLAKDLQRSGFDVVRVTTGAGAIDCAKSRRPDLILLDVHLPDTDGYEVAGLLKQRKETCAIPIVFHSASSSAEGAQTAAACGAHAFLTYPIEREHLMQVIRGGLAQAASKAR